MTAPDTITPLYAKLACSGCGVETEHIADSHGRMHCGRCRRTHQLPRAASSRRRAAVDRATHAAMRAVTTSRRDIP